MELAWLVDLCAFLLHVEISCESLEKLLLSQTVEVLYNAVVVDDLELAVRECYSHEVVVLLVTSMVRVLAAELCAHEGSSCCTVVTVSYIECRDICEDLSDAVDVGLLADHPEMVAEAVLCNEVVLRLAGYILSNDCVYLCVVRISEEYRLDVGVLDTYVDHTVLFLVLSCELMLLDCS